MPDTQSVMRVFGGKLCRVIVTGWPAEPELGLRAIVAGAPCGVAVGGTDVAVGTGVFAGGAVGTAVGGIGVLVASGAAVLVAAGTAVEVDAAATVAVEAA